MRINGHPAPRHTVMFEQERHRYYLPDRPEHRFPSITGVIDALGLGFPSHRLSPERLDAVRQRGTYVHGCAELRASDDLDASRVEEEYAGWVKAMLEAYKALQLRPLLAEEPLYEPTYDFAGRLDFFGWAPGLVRPPAAAVIEWKTGDYSGADMQLGAQAALLRANYASLGPISCFIIHLHQNGGWWAEHMPEEQGWQDFAAARRLYARLQRRNKATD